MSSPNRTNQPDGNRSLTANEAAALITTAFTKKRVRQEQQTDFANLFAQAFQHAPASNVTVTQETGGHALKPENVGFFDAVRQVWTQCLLGTAPT